jgi:hypothetical protein
MFSRLNPVPVLDRPDLLLPGAALPACWMVHFSGQGRRTAGYPDH